ncbi:MAG TPA: L-dopachrome tautomerase-related protein [Planctomycetota bacterium]|nr:L-dopachrome tautomerase-related protein [Planctomycetota bacterium]
MLRVKLLASLAVVVVHASAADPVISQVAEFGDQQPTGVAVCAVGRIFVNFPRWRDDVPVSVAEILADGALKPFPDRAWNEWRPGSAPDEHFVCVQSVHYDGAGTLWVLDAASPKMEGVVSGGAKLVQIDLADNRLRRVVRFDESIALPGSYLNDVRISPDSRHAFITDSGAGAIVVVELESGASRRLLDGHASVQADGRRELEVEGKKLLAGGATPRIHADGIALSPDGAWLYWHPLTGDALWRAPTASLIDPALTSEALAATVERVADTGAHDGIEFGRDGKLYLTRFETSEIARFDPTTKAVETVVRDPRLSWPDSIAFQGDRVLLVTASQIQHMPRFNDGVDTRTEPYRLWRIELSR